MNIDTPTKLSVPSVVPTRRAVDDELLGSGLKLGLQQQGWQVDWVRVGIAAELEMFLAKQQAVVLDLGLPRQHAIQTLQTVRSRVITTPVLVLTARDAVCDQIAGLDTGAGDYLVKTVDLFLTHFETEGAGTWSKF